MVSLVKDNSDQDSWFSAKPIIVGNSSNIIAGTELNLRPDVHISYSFGYENTLFAGTYRGAVESLIGEDADSEWLIWILNDQT